MNQRLSRAVFGVLFVLSPRPLTPPTSMSSTSLRGRHRGQMLPRRLFFDAAYRSEAASTPENAFVKGSHYTIDKDEGTAKLCEVSHLYFGIGLAFEYMPFDHVGAKIRFKRNSVVQKTNFGTDYQTASYLYKDLSF